MLLRKRISIKIAAIIGAIGLIAMAALFFTINHFLTAILEKKSIEDMNVIVRDRAELIETYIQDCCDFMDGLSKSSEVIELLENPDDKNRQKDMQATLIKFAKQNSSIEGVYVAKWDSFVLSHNISEYCGKTLLSKEEAKDMEEFVKNSKGAFCAGIVSSPMTGAMVLPIQAAVHNEKGEAIGFVGAGFYTTELSQKLATLANMNTNYSLINARDNMYIFDEDFDLVGTVCENQNLIDSVDTLKNFGNQNARLSYTNDEYIVTCYYMANRGWVFTIALSKESVFHIVENARSILILVCIFIAVLMIVVGTITMNYQMRPIHTINTHLNKLTDSDYSKDPALKKLCRKDNEFGMIAKSVDELHSVLENQYELFHEILESQTVGTLVTNFADNEILLINKMALKLYGLEADHKENITLSDIQALFDEKETEKIREVRELTKLTKEEIVYETTLKHIDGKRLHLLSHAKSMQLPNGEAAIIFSFIDITTRKKLEQNLVTLSETDELTQICNRRSGEYKVKKAILEGQKGLFCLFDANKFKYVNDSFGHAAGDQVLIEIAKNMKKTFRTSDILIRLGGDEFVVFAPDIVTKEVATVVLDRFIENIGKIDIPELHGHKISISLGAVIVTENEEFSKLYTKADSLMYDCKNQGGSVYKFY